MNNVKIVTRRDFLKSLAILGAGAVTWGALPNFARAANNNSTKLLFLNLNGGLDGLYALQPSYGDVYSTLSLLRPTLKTDPNSLLSAADGFGFHPNLTLFKSLFDSGNLSTVLGVGYERMSRSHLESEVIMSRGVPSSLSTSKSGFLNRLGAVNGWDSLHAISVTGNDLAFEGGEYRGIQVRSLEDFYFRGFASSQERNHLVATSYSLSHDAPIEAQKEKLTDFAKNYTIAADSIDAIKQAVQNHSPLVNYPSTQFGKALKDIDILFSSPELNTQVGYMRVGGFDTHSNQKQLLDSLLLQLNDALSAFVSSMIAKNLWNNLIVIVSSEFGRTNKENGSAGTDHGGANAVFLLGGTVNGGNIYGTVTSEDLTSGGWLDPQYNIIEIYRRAIERIGLDPNAVFAENVGASLNSLFI